MPQYDELGRALPSQLVLLRELLDKRNLRVDLLIKRRLVLRPKTPFLLVLGRVSQVPERGHLGVVPQVEWERVAEGGEEVAVVGDEAGVAGDEEDEEPRWLAGCYAFESQQVGREARIVRRRAHPHARRWLWTRRRRRIEGRKDRVWRCSSWWCQRRRRKRVLSVGRRGRGGRRESGGETRIDAPALGRRAVRREVEFGEVVVVHARLRLVALASCLRHVERG